MAIKSFINRILGNGSISESSTNDTSGESSGPTLGDVGMDKLKAVIAEVTGAFPLFEKAGFEVEEVQVEIGLAPKLMPRFRHVKTIAPAEQEALIAEAGNKKLVKFMLISLFKSLKMNNLINDPKLDFHAIEIDLTAVPSVRGIFKAVSNSDKIVRLGNHE
ncbi:MAG: hypothetical protein HWE27_16800 [Gammaproteobacteria bacterium]|nr:hypothetical protein [Gammaproteobacteria bacterium]